MGCALRTTVVSLSVSSCSINTLSEDRERVCVGSVALTTIYHVACCSALILPGQMCQGLGHILAGVGADFEEHHLVFLHTVSQQHE